jgi:hypothetical protein
MTAVSITVANQTTLDFYVEKYGEMPQNRFVGMHPFPFLLIELREGRVTESGGFETVSPDTNAKVSSSSSGRFLNFTPAAEVAVVPVIKSDRNNYHDSITLGRSVINDIVIHYAWVSRLHAFFRKNPDTGEYAIQDAGSAHGTTLDRVPLKPGEPETMESGQILIFSKAIRATFFTPPDLYVYIQIQKRVKG